MWVRVWLCANETRRVSRPGSWALYNLFTFLLPCTRPEEIVPVSTRGKRRKKNNNGKKQNRQKKKKKSGNLMKRAQKNFERNPRKKIFLRAKPYAVSESKNSRTKFVN